MTLESNQKQKSLAEIKKEIENQWCPDEMCQVKSHVDILKKDLEFYLACKLLNLARDKQRTLRQQQKSVSAKEWWQEEVAQDEVWNVPMKDLLGYEFFTVKDGAPL